jgi:hypothetical protein
MKKILIILFIYACTVSCTHYPAAIEAVLQQAGGNRGQLEKVLKHYSRHPADSLKLRAAEFLIVNMPGKYAKYYDAPWEDVAAAGYLLAYVSDREKLLNDYHLGTPVVQEDLHYITAGYLINNIEMAFQSWRAAPWGKHVSFALFCEEILPYRISNEPLENWREQALASFADVYRNLLDSSGMTVVRACSKVNEKLPSFIYGWHFPSMSYRQLMASTRGSYEHQATLAAFVMRAMGIPVTLDLMLQPSLGNRCAWNIVCDSAGRHIPFVATEYPPGSWTPGDEWVMMQVLRRTFRRQSHSANIPFEIPHSLDNLIDVTPEYGKTATLDIAILPETELPAPPPEYACLCVAGSSPEWTPACWGKYRDGAYRFNSPGANMLYLPVIYNNGKQTPFNKPFFLTDEGKMIYFEQHSQSPSKQLSVYPRWRDAGYKATNAGITGKLSGRWLFEDTTNYGKAAAGKDLIAYGMTRDNREGWISTAGLQQTEGPRAGKKAVRVSTDNYFKCTHGVPHNGKGENINEYAILIDFRMPEQNNYIFFQTDVNNTDEINMFLYYSLARFRVSRHFCYVNPPLRENEWYRFIISARLGQSLKYYLNGELVFVNYNTKHGMQDSRLSWPKDELSLFTDNNSDIDVSEVAVFNRALADEEAFSLGCAGNEWYAPITNKNNDEN